jgi:HPt (histidine-containing phosphotransfer) domain-containing protein
MDELIIENLKKIKGLSVSDGLLYCGSIPAYIKFINSFYNSIDKKSSDIEEAYDKEDYELYTMKVHSLKSTARIAGMPELSELALKLEEAGRAGDTDLIGDRNAELLELYRSYKDKLAVLDDISKEKTEAVNPISESELKDAYSALYDSIAMEDFDAVELILKEVMNYSLPESDRDVMNRLDTLLKNMDWDEMAKLISK